MLAAVTRSPGEMVIEDVSGPGPARAGNVIVRPEAVGICGSDFHLFSGDVAALSGARDFCPRIQGHEVSAIVEDPGDATKITRGDRVAICPLLPCGTCYPCRAGRPNVCPRFRLVGVHLDGGLQQRLEVPASTVFGVGDLDPDSTAFVEPASVAVYALARANLRPGEQAVVFGAGPIGLAEPPDGTGLDSWRSAKSDLLGALRPLTPELTVKGQYQGYLDVNGVAPGSKTETYAAIRLAADSWRWADVPILIRAGKCLPLTATEVTITFKRPPYDAFGLGDNATTNTLRFRINPDDRVSLSLVGKKPGVGWQPAAEDLRFAENPGSDLRPYDRLIGAALDGERWLFASEAAVEAAWRVVDPVLGDVVPVHNYQRGSWGPDQAAALLPPGETWHDPVS